MTYSPYGDRDSGGTRTDVDTEVHDDHDQEDRADDGFGHDTTDHDANGHDANGHDGAAAPFQRDSTDDESVGGDVVDQDGNVVEAVDADSDEGDRPETVDTESAGPAESAESAESAEAPDGVEAERAGTPEAEANVDDVAVADTEAGTDEDPDGDVRADEATATDVDVPEHADELAERDSATEQAMAGDDGPTEVPGDVADEHDEATAMAGGDREYAEGEPVDTAYDGAYDEAIDANPTAANAGADGTLDDDRADDTDSDHTEADQVAAADGTLDDDRANEEPADDAPVAGAVDADYVAVGVAEPMTESEVADITDADGPDATQHADDGTAPLDAAPPDAAPFDAAAVDETAMVGAAVGMMPGDAPVPDAPVQVLNADATRDRWQQIQLGFIDDPRGSVESARSLVVEAVEARISALRDRQTALDGWQSEATPDTEVLRAAIQGYRDMLNSLTDTP